MELGYSHIEKLTSVAKEIAEIAGKYIVKKSQTSFKVNHKSGSESEAFQVVTEVDLQAQKIILEKLSPTMVQYDLGLLTEESEDNKSRFDKDYFWCIDPLDGTLPFTESTPGYSVSIALVSKNGEAVIGVIYDPVKDILYRAIANRGAFKNNQPLSISAINPSNQLSFITDRSLLKHPKYDWILDELQKLSNEISLNGVKVVHHGGAALNACWVLENSPAVYLKFPKSTPGGGSIWDFAASACIVAEAGGYVSDIHGNPLDLNRQDSTFMNHRGVVFASRIELKKLALQLFKKL